MKKNQRQSNLTITNKAIYYVEIALILVGIVLLYYAKNNGCKCKDILCGLGAGIITSTLVSLFISIANNIISKRNLIESKTAYLYDVYDKLSDLIGCIIWFDKHWFDNQMKRDLSIQDYSSLKFQIFASQAFENDQDMTIEAALQYLEDIKGNYNIDKMKDLNNEVRESIQKMFNIIAFRAEKYLSYFKKLENESAFLQQSHILKIDDVSSLASNYNLAILTFVDQNKNIEAGINLIIDCMELIKSNGLFNTTISITANNYINISEL